MPAQEQNKINPEEYLSAERQAETKNEFCDGDILEKTVLNKDSTP